MACRRSSGVPRFIPVAVQAERTAIKIKVRNDVAESRMTGPDYIQLDKLNSLSASFQLFLFTEKSTMASIACRN